MPRPRDRRDFVLFAGQFVEQKKFDELLKLASDTRWVAAPASDFPSQYFDKESGLSYNYFRDYDGTTWRYVQSDPIGLNGRLNTYSCFLADPISNVDPTGDIVPLIVIPGLVSGGAVASGVGYIIARNMDGEMRPEAW